MPKRTPKRIAYVVKRYPRYSETFIVNEILAHENAGLEVFIFALRPSVDTHFQNIISRVKAPVHYLPRKEIRVRDYWSQFLESARSYEHFWQKLAFAELESDPYCLYQSLVLAEKIQELDIDHIHAHFMNTASTVARIAAKLTQKPYSVTAHAKDIFHESVVPEKLRPLLDECKFVVTVSDFNVAYLSRHFDCRAPVVKIYNGLDLDLFRYAPNHQAQSANMIAVGRLVEKKGFNVLINACAQLKSRGMGFTCEIVGSGDLQGELARQIKNQDLEAMVRLVGPRPQNQLMDMINQANMLVAPCIVGRDGNRDGLPTVLVEAMALGTPCVASDVAGIPEAIVHEQSGLLCNAGDVEGLANQMQRLLEDSMLGQRLARQARDKVEMEFNVHKNAAHLRELFFSSG